MIFPFETRRYRDVFQHPLPGNHVNCIKPLHFQDSLQNKQTEEITKFAVGKGQPGGCFKYKYALVHFLSDKQDFYNYFFFFKLFWVSQVTSLLCSPLTLIRLFIVFLQIHRLLKLKFMCIFKELFVLLGFLNSKMLVE